MYKKILCVICVVSLLVMPMSHGVKAENGLTENYEFYECDYNTREVSTYTVPVVNTVQSTWELFSDAEVSNMSAFMGLENNTLMPNTIIGNDTRIPTPPSGGAPYSSVVFIYLAYDNDGDGIADDARSGTGFLVSSKVVVTAAHVVHEDGMELVEMRIYTDVHSASEDISVAVADATYYYPARWTWSTNWSDTTIRKNYDYCVIELFTPQIRPYYFNCVMSSNADTPQNVYVSGYPGDMGHQQVQSYGQMTYTDYYICRLTNDAMTGMSGGPIYRTDCIGIITRQKPDYNEGNLFTPDIYNLICSKIADNQ